MLFNKILLFFSELEKNSSNYTSRDDKKTSGTEFNKFELRRWIAGSNLNHWFKINDQGRTRIGDSNSIPEHIIFFPLFIKASCQRGVKGQIVRRNLRKF